MKPVTFLKTTDLARRYVALRTSDNGHVGHFGGLLFVGAITQTIVVVLLPLLAWLTWPFVVFGCYKLRIKARTQNGGSVFTRFMREIFQLSKKPSTFISLILYGLLSFIIFRGLVEAFKLIPVTSLIGILPSAVITLFPYVLAQAIALLFIAACSARLVLDESDPLTILTAAVRDLILAPLSFFTIVLFLQSFLLTYLAIQVTMVMHKPLLSSILGHGPYALLALAWALGHPNHARVAQ